MKITNNGKPSAAKIKIAKREPTDLIGGLRRMLDRFPPEVNAHDRADTIILACLGHGIRTRSAIIEVSLRLGFKRGHVAIRLEQGIKRHWAIDEEGRYHALSS